MVVDPSYSSRPALSHLPPRLIASDVDGTLLTPDHHITQATQDAISQARESGVVVVLASARGPQALGLLQAELGLSGQPFVAFQGALVGRHLAGGETDILAEHRLTLASALIVAEAFTDASIPLLWFDAERWYFNMAAEVVDFEARVTGVPATGLLDLGAARARGIGPHKIMVPPDPDHPGVIPGIIATLPSDVVPHLTGELYYELTAPGADKSHGLAALADSLGLESAEIAAIGDGHNDTGMFALAGRSYAMGNAAPEVQAAAQRVTASNSEDGLAAAIRDLLS